MSRRRPFYEPFAVEGVWLRRDGDHAVVLVEVEGEWHEVIREHYDGNFSHITESGGIRSRVNEAWLMRYKGSGDADE